MKRFLFASLLVGFFFVSASGQIAQWTFQTSVPITAGPHAPEVGFGSGLGFHAGASTYSNPTGNGSTESFSSNNWVIGDYYQFQIATTNYTDINISFDHISSGTGPRDFIVQYSTDGSIFTTFGGTGGTYVVIENAGANTWASGSHNANSYYAVDLSSITALNNQATVYFRLVDNSTTSTNGGIVASGGTSRVDNFTVTGTFTGSTTNFYSKSAGNLTDVTTWGTNTDGSGTQPVNFTTDGQIFNVVNRVSATLDANWTVSGTASKVIVGDGLGGTTLILPGSAALIGTIDVSNLSTLQIINTTLPTFGTMQVGSTVEYAQTSTPYVVPTGTTYHHLTISSGGAGNIKTFASGTVYVNGNLIVDGVTGFNGSATPFSTVNLAGNFTLQNSATFEPILSGEGNRMSLICSGTVTQTLSGGDFYIFRIQTPASGTVTIALSGANLTLGNPSGGGFDLRLASHTLSIGSNTLTLNRSGIFYGTNLGTLSGIGSSNLIIDKTTGSAAIGSIGFASGAQSLNNLSYNCTSGSSTDLSLTSSLTTGGTITLTAGKIDIGANTLISAGTISGGSTSSYIKTSSSSGNLILAVVSGARNAPIGNSTYNPLTITNTSGHNWTVHVEDVLTVDDPAFASNIAKAVLREWHITPSVNPPVTGADLVFQWDDSDPTQIGASYNNLENVQIWREVSSGQPWGNDWVAVGVSQTASGTPPGVRTAIINGWSSYSPFAISNISGPLPIKLFSFNAVKINSGLSRLNWELAICCSSAARFEVQKSVDGRNYSTLATLAGSETNRFYVSTDNNLGKGITYYRLKMVDVGNVITYSKTIAIVNDSNEILITSLAPNPVHSNAMITVSTAKATSVDFKVFDMSGNMVKQWQSNMAEGNNTITINVDGLAAGVYHILAGSNAAKAFSRFIKQ